MVHPKGFAYCKSSAVEAKRRLMFVALRGNKKRNREQGIAGVTVS